MGFLALAGWWSFRSSPYPPGCPPQPKSPKTGKSASITAAAPRAVRFNLLKRSAALRAEFRHTLSRRGSPPAVCTAGADYGLGCAAVCAEFSAALRAAGRAYPCLPAHGSRHGGRSFLTDTCVIHPIHRAAAVPNPVSVIPAHQNIRKLVHSLLILAVQVGIGAVGAVAVAQLQLYLVKPRGIHSNRHVL